MDSALSLIRLTDEELAMIPLAFHTIYTKPTVTAEVDAQMSRFSKRYQERTQMTVASPTPISKLL